MDYKEFGKDDQIATLKQRIRQLEGERFTMHVEQSELLEIKRQNILPVSAQDEVQVRLDQLNIQIRSMKARIRAVVMQLDGYQDLNEAVDSKAPTAG